MSPDYDFADLHDLSADEHGVTFKYKDYRIEGPPARAGLQIQIRQTVGVGGARSACGHLYSGRSPRIGAKVCATKAPWYSGELGLSGTVSAGNASLAIALESGRSRLG